MEELAEGAIKVLLRFIGVFVRALIWLIWEFCFETIAWYIGWPICRALSFNQFPNEKIMEHEQVSTLTNFFVSLVGLGSLIFLAYIIAQLTGSG